MRGEHGRCTHRGEGRVEVEPSAGRSHQLANPLRAQETRVPLVHVEDVGVGQGVDPGVLPHRAHSTDTGKDFLVDPVFLIASVEPVGDHPEIRVVVGDVGIQEQ